MQRKTKPQTSELLTELYLLKLKNTKSCALANFLCLFCSVLVLNHPVFQVEVSIHDYFTRILNLIFVENQVLFENGVNSCID